MRARALTMSKSTEHRPRRWRRCATWVLAIGSLLPIVLYGTRDKTLYPIAWKLLAQRARAQGWDLRAGRLTGNAWSELQLLDLEASPLDNNQGALRNLRLHEATLRYRLLDLIRDGISGLKAIQAEGLSLRLDLAVAQQSRVQTPLRLPGLPRILPDIRVNRAQIEILRGPYSLLCPDATLELVAGTGSKQLAFEAPQSVFRNADRERRFEISASASYDEGRLEDGDLWIDDSLWIDLEEWDLRASEQGKAHLVADFGLAAQQARVQISWLDHTPRLSANVRGLQLDQLHLDQWLGKPLRIAGEAHLELEARQSSAGWNVGGRVRTNDLLWKEQRLGDLESIASWDPKGLTVSKLSLVGEVGNFNAKDVLIPTSADASAGAFDQAEGYIGFDSTNLIALLDMDRASGLQHRQRPIPHELHLAGALKAGRLQLEPGRFVIGEELGAARWKSGWIDLAPRDGRREVNLEATVACEDLSSVTGLLGYLGVSGSLYAAFELSGELDNPAGTLQFSASKLKAGSLNVGQVELEAKSRMGMLDLKRLALVHSGQDILTVQGTLPIDVTQADAFIDGPVGLTARIDWPAGVPIALPSTWGSCQAPDGIQGDIQIGGSWSQLEADASLEAPSVRAIDGQLAKILGDAAGMLRTKWRWSTDRLRMEQLEADCADLRLVSTGQIALASDIHALLSSPISWKDIPIEVEGDCNIGDLAWCTNLSDALLRASGQMHASFELKGPLTRPLGTADIEVHGASARLVNLPPIESLQGSLEFRDQRWVLNELSGEMGKGEVRLSGTIAPTDPQAWDLHLQGSDALLLRDPSSRVRADLDLRLQGSFLDPLLAGSVGLRRVRLRENVDLLGILGSRPKLRNRGSSTAVVLAESGALAKLRVDVRVNTVEPIELLSNVAKAGMRGSVQLQGRADALLPIGDLFLDPSVVSLPGGPLELTGGIVRFDPAHPSAPNIDVNGETRLAGYDITVHATGDASAPQIDLSSSPALPVDQLLLLLLSGQLPAEGGSAGLSTARSLTVYLAKDFFSQWSGTDDDAGESWLDRLEIVSGQEVSRSGLTTLEATYRLSRQNHNAKRSWYAVAERDRYEDVNFGMRLVVRLR